MYREWSQFYDTALLNTQDGMQERGLESWELVTSHEVLKPDGSKRTEYWFKRPIKE